MKFYKLHGAGNDFVFLAGNKKITADSVVKLCDRNFGIGADGLILIKKSDEYDFSMKYFNSDGSPAGFCANGGRCAVFLAHRLGYFDGNKCRFSADDGTHEAKIIGPGMIRMMMMKPRNFISGLKFKKIKGEWYFVNTGVEHAVGYFSDISKIDVDKIGRAVRNSSYFTNGTNVDFVKRSSGNTLKLRTYERGVEGETKACGTGVTAAAWIDMMMYPDGKKRKVVTVSGIEMIVEIDRDELYLTGPAEFVFSGNTELSY